MAGVNQPPGGATLPLRDLHLPDPPGWWPPAPGWWLLAGLCCLVLVGAVLLIRRYRRLAYRRAALKHLQTLELENLSDRMLLEEISRTLRRAALAAFPSENCAGLEGDEWLRFLDRSVKDQGFSKGPGCSLARGPYQPRPECDRRALFDLCRRWLKALPPVPKSGGRS